jgi:DNA-binding LacI/PurR family transcriptional regulator
LKDVAKLANTSIASVSAVLSQSDKRYVSAELRNRILKAAKELNYVKSSVASGLRGANRKVIALLVPQFGNPFFTRLAVSVEEVARENDYTIFICDTKDNPEQELKIVKNIISHRVNGIIISPTVSGKENTELLRQYDIPYVVVDRPLKDISEYDYVTNDNYQSGAMCAREFLEHGHKRFGYLGWQTPILNITQRKLGFEETISSQKELYDYRTTEVLTLESGYRITKELFTANKGITAVLYGHHALAPGGLKYFREAGIQIPQDVSIILIGSPEWACIIEPKFTNVYQPVEEMGRIATNMLLDKINGEHKIFETRILKNVLIRGNSVRSF